ncbi:MAG TPA: zinc-finger domain-containing protein [Acetobacteraceae bacterium]|nr:zinc-finger domain-containing protein [Acetobacteraceae bacterium]
MPDGATAQIPTETIHVDDPVVACDGGVGALGHPRVFLRIENREVMCPYCSRLFILNEGTGSGHGH